MFKKAFKIPVATVGSYNLELAEEVISENKADVIAMARTMIADPECVNKARTGNDNKIRHCVRCNTCINRSYNLFLTVRCAVNPVIGGEAEFVNPPALDSKKKVVVIGGGPAGMEAARRAAERGHEVVLFEKETSLGGTLRMASAAAFKTDMKKYLDWSARMTMNIPGLIVKLSTEAIPQIVKAEKPDDLVIAAGSALLVPVIPGIKKQNVVWAGDVEIGKVKVGEKVVVAGAGLTGLETSLDLAWQGKKVTLIDMLPTDRIGEGSPAINILALKQMLGELNVEIKTEVELRAVTGSGISAVDNDSKTMEISCDTIVLALGAEPRADIVAGVKDLAPDIYTVGDCNN